MVGYTDGTVRPEANITRAEAATVFFRLMTMASREDNWSKVNDFSDVDTLDWFNNAVSTMANAGIITGYPDGTFRPNNTITRAEIVVIIIRFYFDETVDTFPPFMPTFPDIGGHWAENYIKYAGQLGYIDGYEDGTFRPDDMMTRAEMARIVNNLLNRRVESEEDMLEDMQRWSDNQPGAWYYYDIQEATNFHLFERKEFSSYEIWTELLPNPDWTVLERPESMPGDLVWPEIPDPAPGDGELDDDLDDDLDGDTTAP